MKENFKAFSGHWVSSCSKKKKKKKRHLRESFFGRKKAELKNE